MTMSTPKLAEPKRDAVARCLGGEADPSRLVLAEDLVRDCGEELGAYQRIAGEIE